MKWSPWILVVATTVACSGQSAENNGLPGIDVQLVDLGADAASDAAQTGDARQDTDQSSADVNVTPGGPIVEIDLEGYLAPAGGAQVSKIYQVAGGAPFSGPVVQGRRGDWVIENDVARFLIEADNRVMSPCPWGGTVVDAASLEEGGDEDILGEICMMVNGGQTFRPDQFDVVRTGVDGGAAVLAASGTLVLNDFLNLPTMVDDYVEGLGGAIKIDINRLLPLRLTIYYVLRPGERGLHVVTAIRNDTNKQEDLLPVYLVASGGDGEYYNPESSSGGFGSGGGGVGISIDNFPFIAFRGDTASYAFAPKIDPDIRPRALPLAGSYLTISGVAATILGADNGRLLPLLSGSAATLADAEEVVHVAPGGTEILEHRLFVGNGSLANIVDPIYQTMDIELGTLTGTVLDSDGQPVAGARVSATRQRGRTMNQAITGANGRFTMTAPPDTYTIRARKGGAPPAGPVTVALAAGATLEVRDIAVKKPARITVRVTTPDDGCDTTRDPSPVPARLSVICVDAPCPSAASKGEFDTAKNSLPSSFAGVWYSGPDGVLEAEVPAGAYRLVVDRGMEWSTWPADAPSNGGIAIDPGEGESLVFDVEIARVVDTPNAYGGDFHVHTITSPDSPVPWADRVQNFMAQGVDVIVSTDHDYISDYRPVIANLGGDPWIQQLVGEEVTTADLGHFNAFPMKSDPSHPRGGAVDWGGGDSYTLLPDALFAAIRGSASVTDPVIQVNHAEGLGLIRFSEADVLRGISYASREAHRLEPVEPDPATGDTKIWSDGFTAMELMNGSSRAKFYTLGRWWMTMIGRGFAPTGTAVTDTHKLYGDLGGAPRTYVFGDTDYSCGDQPFAKLTNYDAFKTAFAADVNAGRAVGTNGPFFTVSVRNGAGDNVGLGETIAADAQTVATLEIQTPEWMQVDTVDVYLNPDPDDVITEAAQQIGEMIPSTETIALTWDATTELVTVKTGMREHRAWRKTLEIPLATDADAFVVFVVRGNRSMAPIHGSGPFAFSNPVFLDADGNGYDNPPYAALANTPPPPNSMPCGDAFCGAVKPTDGPLLPKDIFDIVRHYDCKDPSHAH